MSVKAVKDYLKTWSKDGDVLEFEVSSATVELAAKALNVQPARIAKTLSFKKDDSCILIVTAGDARVDNAKYKAQFGCKAKMLTSREVEEFTGHTIGGVCPFALPEGKTKTYLDISLKRFDTVYPACGSSNSAIELTCEELFEYSHCVGWIDVCRAWQE